MKRVLLAGEGRNELGGWYDETPYRSPELPGVIEALLGKVKSSGWEVVDAVLWRSIRKIRVRGHATAEMRNVMGVVLKAKERDCDVVAFSRDQDGDEGRGEEIEKGIAASKERFRDCPAIAGGVAVRKLESWIAAILGERRSEEMRRPEEFLASRRIREKDTAGMASAVKSSDFNAVPEDAWSLRKWLSRAEEALEA